MNPRSLSMSTRFAMDRLFSRCFDDFVKSAKARTFRGVMRTPRTLQHQRVNAHPPNWLIYEVVNQLLLASSTARVSRITVTLI